MVKAAFQGEKGAFSEDAIYFYFKEAEAVPCPNLSEVFKSVHFGWTDYAVVPVENSLAGSINETYDLLLAYDLHIIGEINLRVHQCLSALPGTKIADIKLVYSHPRALDQCQDFLNKHGFGLVPVYDTAGAAKKIKEEGIKEHAAISSERAAKIYGLEIIARDIESNIYNYTKFFVLSKQKTARSANSKTSIVFAAKNVPGALYESLGIFATRKINLTKLESRPSKEKAWEYVFYVDFEGHIEDQICQEALAELREKASFVKVLGSYLRAENQPG
jgi:prephenate dehydratase